MAPKSRSELLRTGQRISATKASEQHSSIQWSLNLIYREAPIGLCYLDTDLRYVYINEWLAAINGIPVEGHLGRTIAELLPGVAAGVESQLRHVIETGQPITGRDGRGGDYGSDGRKKVLRAPLLCGQGP